MYTNMDSIQNKMNELRHRVISMKPHFILITETWLNEDIPDSLVHIDGYNLLRKDRIERSGGGVCIYVKEATMDEEKIINFEINVGNPNVESMTLDIKIGSSNFVLSCVYRSTSSSANDTLQINNYIREVCNLNKDTLIFGDFNYPEIVWNEETVVLKV
uniref:Endonuclease/exonuclease/phosphatase domain-containing protein n=1 Tax=Cacopsylla melanoneura TaxID=428564 RepID=A0A8D8VWD3_9HEMI